MVRTNQLGYEMIPESFRKELFGENTRPPEVNGAKVLAAKTHIESFGFSLPPESSGVKFPELTLPHLAGLDIKDALEKVAEGQLGHCLKSIDEFVHCELPPLPEKLSLKLKPGWTRYSWDGSVDSVPFPMEDVFTFDTETFVQGGSFPVIASAVSTEACYIWLAPEMVNPSLPHDRWEQYDMVPVGKDRLIIAHNASYDRIRTREAYSFPDKGIENYWLDTLSMHIATSGLASGQRWLYVLSNKEPDLLTPEEKRKLRYKPKWLDAGATNSLVECYNYHVYETRRWTTPGKRHHKMELADKAIRDVFVKARSMAEFKPILIDLIWYALKDSWYTAELCQSLYPRYRNATPSNIALMGHFWLGASRVLVSDSWYEWLEKTEDVYNQYVRRMSAITRDLLEKEVSLWKKEWDKDWKLIPGDNKREKMKSLKAILKVGGGTLPFPNINRWVHGDPWRVQSDWTPKIIGNTKKFPEFKGQILPQWCSPTLMDSSADIGVKTVASHLLLKLKWKGSPLQRIEDKGWCYWDTESESLERIPHPKRAGENVGGVLSKDFIKSAEKGVLSSDLESAREALDIANAISYWTSVRKRCMERYALPVKTPSGSTCRMMIPSTVPHGTTTRRVVEPLFATLCSTKNFRIGTELKTRMEAPDGLKKVGADFDGEEMRIAAIYADAFESGLIGGSPLGFQVLSGSKDMGTDSHTKITRETFPEFFENIVFDKDLGLCEIIS